MRSMSGLYRHAVFTLQKLDLELLKDRILLSAILSVGIVVIQPPMDTSEDSKSKDHANLVECHISMLEKCLRLLIY